MRPIAFAAASLIAVLPCCASQETARTPAAAHEATAAADPLLLEQVPADAQVCVAWNVLEHPGYAGSRWEKFNTLAQRKPPTVETVREDIHRTLTFFMKVGAKDNPGMQDSPQIRASIALASDILASASVHGGTLYVRRFDLHRKIGRMEMHGPSVPTVVLLVNAKAEGAALLEKWKQCEAAHGANPVLHAECQDGLFRLSFGTTGQPEPWIKPEASLAKNPRFVAASAALGPKPAMLLYADADNLVARLKEWDAWQKQANHGKSDIGFEKLDAMTGLSGLKTIAVGGRFVGDGQWQWNALIEAPAPRKGALAMMDGATVSPDLLDRVPASAEAFTAVGFDLGGTIDAVVDLVAKEEPNARKEWNKGLDQAHQLAGIDIRSVLAGLGTQWLMFSDPMATGGGFAGTVVVSPLRNGTAVDHNLTLAATLGSTLIRQQMAKENNPLSLGFLTDTFRGATIHRLGFPLVSPGYAVQDNTLYAALLPQAIQGAIRPVKQPITSSSAYRKLRAQVVPAGATPRLLGYSDLPRRAPHTYGNGLLLYQYALGLGEMLTGEPCAMELPLLSDLLPVLTPDLSAAWTDAQGLHLRSQGPFPGASLVSGEIDGAMLGTGAVMAGVLVPVLGVAKKNANVLKEQVNTRNTELGAVVYATSNKDYYPGWTSSGKRAKGNWSGLTHLLFDASIVPTQVTSLSLGNATPECPMVDPATGASRRGSPEDFKVVDAWVRAHSSVIFIPDVRKTYRRPGMADAFPCNQSNQDQQCIVAFTDPAKAIDPKKLAVIRGDTSSATESQAELDQMLREQYGADSAELAAEFREGKLPPEAQLQP